MSNKLPWNEQAKNRAIKVLNSNGMIVSPTKVGYIIISTSKEGLNKKFEAKQRSLKKPAVVLCSSIEQLQALAEINEEIIQLYQEHWEDDVLLGCILPWKKDALKLIPENCYDLVMDNRKTSCFVIKFGIPSEEIVKHMWEFENKLSFASSANPSGRGNRGVVAGIGDRIESYADLIIEADDYVASIQPNNTNRYEQGVMVSMVDENGKLIPEQKEGKLIKPCPIVIRKGLDIDYILSSLASNFNTWEYSHGNYY